MSLPIAAWRATYTPGTWVVLATPTSLVVLQPAPARVSGLLNQFWDDILGATSIESLSALLTQHNLAELGSVGLFFWGDAGINAMVRGQIRVTEMSTGRVLVAGQGGPGWQPVSIGDQSVRIDLEPVDPSTVLHLPLAVGGVTASGVVISTAPESLVRSAQSAVLDGGVFAALAAESASASEMPLPGVAPIPIPVAPPIVAPVVPPGFVPSTLMPGHEGNLSVGEDDLITDDSVPLDAALAQNEQPVMNAAGADESTGDILPADGEVVAGGPASSDSDAIPVELAASSVEEGAVPETVLPTSMPLPSAVESAFAPPPSYLPSPPTAPMAPPPPMYAPGAGLVSATVCTLGHPNPPGSDACRQCRGPVGSISRLVQRPTLAVVRSNFGVALDLDSVILIGRAPDTQGDTSVRVLKVPSPNTDISRSHLKVRANEWQIEVTDLNSTNGSVLAVPGQAPVRMVPNQPVVVPLGTVIDLGDGVQVRIDPPR